MFRSLRLALLATGLTGLIAAIAVLSQALWSFESLNNSAAKALVAKDVVADILPPPMYLIELRLVLSQAVEATMPVDEAAKQVDRLVGEYQVRVDYWTANPPFGLEADLLGMQHKTAQALIAAAKPSVIAPLKAGDKEAARRGLDEIHKLYLAHRQGVDVTVKSGSGLAENSIGSFDATRKNGLWTMSSVTLAMLLGMIGCYFCSRRSILRPLDDCVALADELANGNLKEARFGPRGDEFGRLQHALTGMRDRLTGMVANTRDGIREIADVSSRIANTSSRLSEHNAEQSSRLKETAESMEKMKASVAENTASAQQATQLAASASTVAAKGGEVVTQVVQTMERISASSRKIHDIIGVIDGLAFQTNILALNAAVEAARAGEGGRGFAVVAAEVRSLAQRSAEAAKAINLLITESVGNVEAGSGLVDHAGRTMEEIVSQVRLVSDLVDTISKASAGQGHRIEDAVKAVTRLDAATAQSATLVEQSASAAGNLNDEAHRLSQTVSMFTVAGETQDHAEALAAQAA